VRGAIPSRTSCDSASSDLPAPIADAPTQPDEHPLRQVILLSGAHQGRRVWPALSS
jgi:hypothetical protein